LTHYLEKGSLAACDKAAQDVNKYLTTLAQSYGDLNESRTVELELSRLRQTGSVPEYLTRFTQHASRVT
jgi:hypothetical protein